MLRNILIGLGFFIAILPYVGFPYSWHSVLSSLSGLAIIFLLMLTRRRTFRTETSIPEEIPQSLHVERKETSERHDMHVEREIVIDTERMPLTPGSEMVVEKKITVERRRRKKVDPEDNQSEATS